jgi:valyl-tRNA synthetase
LLILQITPAHDPNDFEVGKRHNLEFINIFTDDGKINSNGGSEFAEMPRFKAREAVTEALQKKVLALWYSDSPHINEAIKKLYFRQNFVDESTTQNDLFLIFLMNV